VAHRPASVEHWIVTGQITRTCPEVILSTGHLPEDAKNMFGSASRGGLQEDVSMSEEIVKVDEELREAVAGPLPSGSPHCHWDWEMSVPGEYS
jgi:hypothetical protein